MCQLPEQGQKWGFLIWLLFSYCALVCIACMSLGKVSFIILCRLMSRLIICVAFSNPLFFCLAFTFFSSSC